MKYLLSDFIADLQAQQQSSQASSTGLDDNDGFKKFITVRLCIVQHNTYSDNLKNRWNLKRIAEIKNNKCIILNSKMQINQHLQGTYWFSVLCIFYIFIKYLQDHIVLEEYAVFA